MKSRPRTKSRIVKGHCCYMMERSRHRYVVEECSRGAGSGKFW